MLAQVPADCFDAILSFLPTNSVAILGGTSSEFMLLVQSEGRRRRRRFSQTFRYTPSNKKARCGGTVEADAFLLPTVKHRVESLFRFLPSSHPSNGLVTQLFHSIPSSTRQDSHVESNSDEDASFQSRFEAHVTNFSCHKLHATILHQSVYSSPPDCKARRKYVTSEQQPFTVTVDRYIGDVLCCFYLLGHSAAGIIDGGVDESMWIARIQHELSVRQEDPEAAMKHASNSQSFWYQAWVFLHSSLLRAAPFSWNQQLRLGIASPCPHHISEASIDVAQGSLLRPHAPFAGCCKTEIMRFLCTIPDFPTNRGVFSQFGPLGPTFRGRDLIQSHVIYPASVLGIAIAFDGMSPDEYTCGPVSQLTPFLRTWANSDEGVIQWLLLLHVESRKARPMSVVPPVITMKTIP